jgi:hypothetical protein
MVFEPSRTLPLGFEDAWLNQTGHKPELLQKNREQTFR